MELIIRNKELHETVIYKNDNYTVTMKLIDGVPVWASYSPNYDVKGSGEESISFDLQNKCVTRLIAAIVTIKERLKNET